MTKNLGLVSKTNTRRLKMKKFFVLIFLVILFYGNALATWTRVNSIGVPNWMIEQDDTLMWINPARTSENTGNLWAEWPAANVTEGLNGTELINPWGGISAETPYADMALFIGRPYDGFISLAGTSNLQGLPDSPVSNTNMAFTNPNQKYDLFLSRRLDNMTLGLRLDHASFFESESSSDLSSPLSAGNDTRQEDSFKTTDTRLVLGALKNNIGPIETLDLALVMRLVNADNDAKTEEYLTDGGGNDLWVTTNKYDFGLDASMSYSLAARGIIPYGESKIISYLQIQRGDSSSKFVRKEGGTPPGTFTVADEFQSIKDSTTFLTMGAAVNRNITERTLMIAGLWFDRSKQVIEEKLENKDPTQTGTMDKEKRETTRTRIPVNLGIETTLSSKASARIGIEKEISNVILTETNDPQIQWDAGASRYVEQNVEKSEIRQDNTNQAATVTIGIGYNIWENLSVDALMRQQILFTGTYLISGVPESIAAQITAKLRY